MTARKTTFTEAEFRAALGRELCDLIGGKTTYQRSLEWLYECRIGLGALPKERIGFIAGGIKLLLLSLRAEAGRAAPCEAKATRGGSNGRGRNAIP
jgi:hypothetical protein